MTIPHTDTSSVEERVNRAIKRLALVSRVCELTSFDLDSDNGLGADRARGDVFESDCWDALRDLVDQALDDLEPIRHAPAAVANWTPEADAETGRAR